MVYSDCRVNSRYHLKVLCIIRKLEMARFISELNGQVSTILLLFAVVSTGGKKSRKSVMDSSVTMSFPHNLMDSVVSGIN